MPPKKLPPKNQQPKPSGQNAAKPQPKEPQADPAPIPEEEVKKSSSMSAQMALEATKKAYDLRQAAYGAGDPNAREEILAKAINKEIEAESFGKAAKYTRSGAFQGLAAGAGLGVQPGVTLGKITGALVGGLVSTVGGLLGGGIGSAYGAMSGPFWDLGEMASHGVRSIVGDFPNWEATSSQKKALEKMVLGAQKTKAPDQGELEEMRDDDGGATQADYQEFARNMTSWIPSMPKMPNMPNMPSIPGFGGQTSEKQPKASGGKPASTAKSGQSQPSKTNDGSSAASKSATSAQKAGVAQPSNTKQGSNSGTTPEKKKPKKLEIRSGKDASQTTQPAVRKPPKLESRQKPAAASA